jgi:hypothetical protein
MFSDTQVLAHMAVDQYCGSLPKDGTETKIRLLVVCVPCKTQYLTEAPIL